MTASPFKHVFLSCGEASGDRYGAALTAALRSLDPDLRISALGGPALGEAGAEIVQPSSELAVMGISEVIRALPAVLGARRRLWKWLDSEKPDLVVPVDFPGFNGGLASRAQKAGIPVFWLIAPQVWAWGGWRTDGYRRKIQRLGTILPFETDFFAERGFDVFPMGHPLIDDYGGDYPFEQALAAREKRLDNRDSVLTVGLLPGSRLQELHHLLPVLKVACHAIIGQLGSRRTRFVASCAPGLDPELLTGRLPSFVEVCTDPLPVQFKTMDLAMVCSGTASLEAALAGVPHELLYRTGTLNHWLGRKLLRTDYIGLSNLILDKPVVREHLQEQATPLPLVRQLLRWLARPNERRAFYKDAKHLRRQCGKPGVWNRTAEAVLEFGREQTRPGASS